MKLLLSLLMLLAFFSCESNAAATENVTSSVQEKRNKSIPEVEIDGPKDVEKGDRVKYYPEVNTRGHVYEIEKVYYTKWTTTNPNGKIRYKKYTNKLKRLSIRPSYEGEYLIALKVRVKLENGKRHNLYDTKKVDVED